MRIFAICLALTFSATLARADPANDGKQLNDNVTRCMAAYPLRPGSQATVAFRLNRWGAIIGTPRINYARLPTDPGERESDVRTIAEALQHCFPTEISDTLGQLMAGHPYTYSWGVHLPRDL